MRFGFHVQLSCALLIFFVSAAAPRSASAQASSSPTRLSAPAGPPSLHGAYRFERAHWIYVHLDGTPHQIGFEHGYLLAPEIQGALRAVSLDNTHKTHRSWQFFRDTAKNIYWPHIETEYREELQGITDGLHAHGVHNIDLWDVVALNGFLETPDYYLPWLERKHREKTEAALRAPGSCSAFVATGDWTRDHKPVIAHNMWNSFLSGEHWRIIFDIAPQHGYRILMEGFPGKIDSGSDFGINSAGLEITETTITGFSGFDPNGIPEFVRGRKAMQYAANIDDFERIMLAGNNGGYANDWLIADNHTGEVARLELGLKVHRLWRTKNGFYVGSNFPSDPTLTKEETDYKNDPSSGTQARRKRWHELMAQYKGQIDAQLAEKFLADHFDAYTRKEGPDERTLCGHLDVSPRGAPEFGDPPFAADGAVSAKVADSSMAAHMSFVARSGRPCGEDFLVGPFLAAHPQFDWQKGVLGDMKGNPWAAFQSGDRAASTAAAGN